MTRAARNQARSALSANLTRLAWQPGQPLAEPVRKLRQADVDLELAEEILRGLLQQEPPRPSATHRKRSPLNNGSSARP